MGSSAIGETGDWDASLAGFFYSYARGYDVMTIEGVVGEIDDDWKYDVWVLGVDVDIYVTNLLY